MFAKTIVDSDHFLDMPVSTQNFYFHLGMRADDDGFINNPKKIMKMIGATDDDMKILLAKRFILSFDNGVIVIKHWRINNYIRSDRYRETIYIDEMNKLDIKNDGGYTEKRVGIPHDNQAVDNRYTHNGDTQVRLGKVRLGKDRLVYRENGEASPRTQQPKFQKPTVAQITEYIHDLSVSGADITFSANKFYDHYESNGWMVGKNRMKDWKAAVRTWASKDKNKMGEAKKPAIDYKARVEELNKLRGVI